MQLIIVESPTKSKTLEKILGDEYHCLASMGHVRDLPKGKLGVDVENNFEPTYVIPTKSRKTVNILKKEIEKADQVILAADEDREGEAIAWHLAQALGLEKFKRIVFHEITSEAIKSALKNPRDIDLNLVNAQQARRILDRLVGYQLSPFLWKKIMRGLSAGRVQSAAVHLIIEREKEIKAFQAQEYWSLKIKVAKESSLFEAELAAEKDKKIGKLDLDQKRAEKISQYLKGQDVSIQSIKQKEVSRHPSPPFTTSTLQQASGNKLGFSSRQTMSLAQELYEKGLITYHRTDSFNLSSFSQKQTADFIKKEIGNPYWPGQSRIYRTKSKGAQQAHEAIRPTDVWQMPEKIKLKPNLLKLYRLIWQRTVSSQMSSAILLRTSIELIANDYLFKTSGQMIKFDGFLKIYPTALKENILPNVEKGDCLKIKDISTEQHFTQPPSRYSEPNLVKTLESLGIGRPSTYAPIISTIQERGYVSKNSDRRLEPTEIGFMVDDLLSEHFPEIVNVEFTAKMEKEFDLIAQNNKSWQVVIKDFYKPFNQNLEKKYQTVEKKDLTEKTDRICPECGKPIIIRMGRYGKFYGCSGFPECRFIEPIKGKDTKTGITCPECQKGEIVEKKGRRGIFYACNRYPDCRFTLSSEPINEKCPKCSSLLVKNKQGKIKCSRKECSFEKEAEVAE